ncbi:MAG: nitroreductase family protein [Bacillota bacterium]
MNSTIELLNKRKSVRAYEEREIPQYIKEEILKSAMRAPTAGNCMLYSIIDIKDDEIKEKLAISCDNQPFIAKSPMLLLFLADYQRSYDYFIHCGVDEICKIKGEKLRTPEAAELFLACSDALIAAHTAVIAAEALGIGSCYIGDIMERYEEHKEMFNLPPYVFPIALVCFGYPAEQQLELPQTKRFDGKYIVFDNVYKSMSGEEFDDMYRERYIRTFREREEVNGARNFGQLLYHNKYDSDFAKEMNRSVKVILKNWNL